MKPESPDNPGNTPPTASQQAHGGLFTWLALSVLAVAVALTIYMLTAGRSHSSSPVIPPVPGVSTLAIPAEATDELLELGERFGQVMDNQRDAGPLIERAEALANKYPDLAEAHALLGEVLMYSGRLDPAIQALQQSLKAEPDQPNIHLLIGTAAMQMDQLELAREHYEQALQLEPDNGRNAIFLANVQYKLDQNTAAIQTLQTAIQRDSQLHNAYALLSDIYAQQGKPKLAMDQIERAIEATPDDKLNTRVTYTLKRAALFRQDNQPAESLAVLDALPREAMVRPDVLRDTATTWSMLDKPQMAAELYERVLSVDPTNDHAAAEAARWWIEADNTEAAQRNLKALRRINPRHPSIPELDDAIQGE